MTANVGDRDRRAALDAGMYAFVEKPVRVEKLFSEIVKCLGG
jgi:CheY-like chemotaxis protein